LTEIDKISLQMRNPIPSTKNLQSKMTLK